MCPTGCIVVVVIKNILSFDNGISKFFNGRHMQLTSTIVKYNKNKLKNTFAVAILF
jgi:hypothetical protein